MNESNRNWFFNKINILHDFRRFKYNLHFVAKETSSFEYCVVRCEHNNSEHRSQSKREKESSECERLNYECGIVHCARLWWRWRWNRFISNTRSHISTAYFKLVNYLLSDIDFWPISSSECSASSTSTSTTTDYYLYKEMGFLLVIQIARSILAHLHTSNQLRIFANDI